MTNINYPFHRTKLVERIYYVREEDLNYHQTLEQSDIGRPYILVQGCIHFVDGRKA